jgi:methionyl-tRNA formyltransferase
MFCRQGGGLVKRLAVVTSLKANKNPVRDFAVAVELCTFNWPFSVVPGDFDVGLVASFGHLIPKSIIESFPLCVYKMRLVNHEVPIVES